MTNTKFLEGPRIENYSGKKPSSIIILLHGYGSNGEDLFSLAPVLSEKFPETVFISPNAPFPCKLSGGYGYEWFDIEDRSDSIMFNGVKAASEIFNSFIDNELKKYNLSDNQLALIGFSQGTMVAIHSGLSRKNKCSCILGYSGSLLGNKTYLDNVESKPPIFLYHGESDDVVSVESSKLAAEKLISIGIEVELSTEISLGHSISQRGLSMGTEFLIKNLNQ